MSAGYTLLNAAFYGVPQMRERMFLIAYRRELGARSAFRTLPLDELPARLRGLPRRSAQVPQVACSPSALITVEPPEADRCLPPAVTAEEAIGDLPPIMRRDLLASGKLRRGARRFDEPTAL